MLDGDFEVMYRCKRVCSFAADGTKTLCTFTDSNKEIFANHLKSHLEVFQCENCPFKTKEGDQFEKHLKDCDAIFSCSGCKFSCDSEAALREHISKDHSYYCNECDYTDSDYVNYGKHVLRHFEHILPLIDIVNRRFNCEECTFQTVNWPKFKHHLTKHNKTFKCLDCNFKCSSKVELVKHVESHKKPKKIVKLFKCDKCQYAAKSEADLKSHAREHILHKCPECKEVFRELFDLQAHYAFHNIVETDFSCVMCWKEFSTANKLKTHLQCHTESKFHCTKCSFSTKYKYSYIKHVKKCGSPKIDRKKKTKKKKISSTTTISSTTKISSMTKISSTSKIPSTSTTKVCRRCGENVGTTRSSLMSHIREKHNENYQKKVTPPDEASLEESVSKEDILEPTAPEEVATEEVAPVETVPEDVAAEEEMIDNSNSKDSSHLCNFCNQTFSSMKLLRAHKMTHSLQPLYECLFCAASFTKPESWEFHMSADHEKEKETHKNKIIKCNICSKFNKSALALRIHFKIAHVDEPKICQICDKPFHSMGLFSRHIKIAHKGCTINWCIFCGENCNDRPELLKHLKDKHKKSRLSTAAVIYGGFEDEKMDVEATEVEVSNPSLPEKTPQIPVEENESPNFVCIICSSKYKYWTSLKFHCKTKHMDENVILCNKCAIMYYPDAEHVCEPKTGQFKKPVKERPQNVDETPEKPNVDTPDKPKTDVEYVSCQFCGNIYSSKKSLYAHVQKKHPKGSESSSKDTIAPQSSKPEGFRCPKCSFTFSKNEYLLNHMRSHKD